MSLPFLSYQTDPYAVSFSISKSHTTIQMSVPPHLISTKHFPHISYTLTKNLPSIFQSTCYNDLHIPFSEEVKKTETAHLFEHIFLEFLASHDNRVHVKKKIYKGVTTWDWRKNPRGSFVIRLNVGTRDILNLSYAMKKTIKLFSEVMKPSEYSYS